MSNPNERELEKRLREAAALHAQEVERSVQTLLAEVEERAIEKDQENPHALSEALERIRLTPERLNEGRVRSIKTFRPRTPPPSGTNGMERVYGGFSTPETEEEIIAALEALQ